MKKILIFLLFVLSASMNPAHAAELAGDYAIVRGVTANEAAYTGKVTVSKRDGGFYDLQWMVDRGDTAHGIGLVEGNILAAASSYNPHLGLIVYKVNGGKLSGRWLTPKCTGQPGIEELQGPAGLNGTYTIVNAYAENGGDPYDGTVLIEPFGDAYHLTWTVGEQVVTGAGLRHGDLLVAAWGDDATAGYYDIKSGDLKGQWVAAAGKRVGSEDLTRAAPKARGVAPDPAVVGNMSLKVTNALAAIDTMTYDSVLRYHAQGETDAQNKDLLRSKCWYKKPGLSRQESVTLYLPTGPRTNVYIGKLEKSQDITAIEKYNSYEILPDGKFEKSVFAKKEFIANTPYLYWAQIVKKMKDGEPYSVGYDQDRNVYMMSFGGPDQSVYAISGDTWLPYAQTVLDNEQGTVVESEWTNITINPPIDDAVFRVPGEQ